MTKLAVLRPEPECQNDVAMLAERGIPAIALPCLSERRIPVPEDSFQDASDGLILTSQRSLTMLHPDHYAALHHLPVLAVGARTAEVARQYGFSDIYAGSGSAHSLCEHLQQRCEVAGRRMSFDWLSGQDVQLDISNAAPDGCTVTRHICYAMENRTTVPASFIAQLEAGEISAVMNLSARTLTAFVQLLHTHNLWHHHRKISVLSISSAACDVPYDGKHNLQWQEMLIADKPDHASMMALAHNWYHSGEYC
jgi:uroporphyrinogen-III synthase